MQTLATSTRTPKQSLDDSKISSDEQLYKNKLAQAEAYIAALESKNKELFSAVCDAYEVRILSSIIETEINIVKLR